jgi:hypothetical protein
VTATTCQLPTRGTTKAVSYVGIIGMALAIASVILRLVHRLPTLGGQFGIGDVVLIASTIIMIPLSVLSIFLARDGLGKDIWTIPPANITEILHIYFFDEMMYITSLALTRTSILLLYLRVFSSSLLFRRCGYALIALHFGYLVAFDLVLILQCRPINLAWTGWDHQHNGICLSINAIGWSAAGINIALDLATIILPLPQLAKLCLPWHKKLPLIFIFLLGFL